mgnify:CR=1 FL=1
MRGVRRQHLRRIPANELQLLACPGGAPRVCGHAHANICTGYLLMSFNCWRGPAVLQVFAGMPAPTRSCPSLRKECLPYTKDNPREKSEEPKKSFVKPKGVRQKPQTTGTVSGPSPKPKNRAAAPFGTTIRFSLRIHIFPFRICSLSHSPRSS